MGWPTLTTDTRAGMFLHEAFPLMDSIILPVSCGLK
jgi:hypothetical protein